MDWIFFYCTGTIHKIVLPWCSAGLRILRREGRAAVGGRSVSLEGQARMGRKMGREGKARHCRTEGGGG